MWFEFLLEGLKKFAGEIIGTLLLIFVLWAFPGLRSLFTKYKSPKKNGDCTMNCVRGKYTGGKHNGRSQTGKTQD